MGRRDRDRSELGLEPTYEGPAVLGALLAHAGSRFDAAEVASRFRHAQAHGAGRDVAIPALFEAEPRFGTPEEARRLYGNLFGLWARVAAGLGAEEDAPIPAPSATPPAPPPPAPLPPRGAVEGDSLPSSLVEAVWRHLDALPARERQRLRDRFAGAQPDLAAWLEALRLDDVGSVAVQDLAFEIWAMADRAFGDRLGRVPFKALREREQEPPPFEADQPALARYVGEVLDLVADEEPGFGPAARAQVERAIAAVVAALGDAREDSPAGS